MKNARQTLLDYAISYNDQYNDGLISRDLYYIGYNVYNFIGSGYTRITDNYAQAPTWFWGRLEFDGSGDRPMISYYPKEDAAKPRSQTIGKFLTFAREKMGLRLSESEAAKYAEWAGENFKEPVFDWFIHTGYDVAEEYQINFYNSCLNNKIKPVLYAENPDSVGQVILTKDGKRFARALFWTDVNGGHYIDRVYPNGNSMAERFLANLATEKGWNAYGRRLGASHAETTLPTKHVIKLKDVGLYPYPDTMSKTKVMVDGEGNRWYIVSNDSGELERYVRAHPDLREVARHEQYTCPYIGESFSVNTGTALRDGERHWDWIPNLKAWASKKALREVFRRTANGDWELIPDLIRSKLLGKFYSKSEVVELTYGAHVGDVVPPDYPWLVQDEYSVTLRGDLPGQDFPPLSYRGVTVGSMYKVVSNGKAIIAEATNIWEGGNPDLVTGRNLRTGNMISGLVAADMTPATDDDVERYLDVFAFGDVVMLTEESDGTTLGGKVYPAGSLAFVQLYHEDTNFAYVYLYNNGTMYTHALPATNLRRVARRGVDVSIGANVPAFSGDTARIEEVADLRRISVRDGEGVREFSFAELVASGLFGTQEAAYVQG